MAWTQQDLDALEAAIKSGVKSVSYAGPPARTVTYQDIDAMRAVLAEGKRDVLGAPGAKLAQFTRGYRGSRGTFGWRRRCGCD